MNFKTFLSLSTVFLLHFAVYGQDFEKEMEIQYQENIKKEYIKDKYIPTDIDDAIVEILRLSDPESIAKFKAGEENEVARKLHFGLGRWMIVNWNFYEGSRMSHYLKMKGLSHPDDMAQAIIIAFHRHLNGLPLNLDQLINHLQQKRLEVLKRKNLIHQKPEKR